MRYKNVRIGYKYAVIAGCLINLTSPTPPKNGDDFLFLVLNVTLLLENRRFNYYSGGFVIGCNTREYLLTFGKNLGYITIYANKR